MRYTLMVECAVPNVQHTLVNVSAGYAARVVGEWLTGEAIGLSLEALDLEFPIYVPAADITGIRVARFP